LFNKQHINVFVVASKCPTKLITWSVQHGEIFIGSSHGLNRRTHLASTHRGVPGAESTHTSRHQRNWQYKLCVCRHAYIVKFDPHTPF